jgi:SpoIID/LytB domain protein
MRERIDAFLFGDERSQTSTIEQLKENGMLNRVHLLQGEVTERLMSSAVLKEIGELATADFVLLYLKSSPLTIGYGALQRMLRAAMETDAALVYADRYSIEQGQVVRHPVIDYQLGSVRDDFDFGSVLLIRTDLLHEYLSTVGQQTAYQYAALYDLRLFLSRKGMLFHLNEFLYTEEESDLRASGEKQFDYVNPANREVQIEMEKAVTAHLRELHALVDPSGYMPPDFNEQHFEVEASVIIPVFNREKTIADAVKSALEQKTNFPFNVIVVDNHSTDKTGEILQDCQQSTAHDQLIVLKPTRHDLGIGGCWNLAVNDARCGRFAVQLDSDDLYSSPNTLQQIVDAFYQQKAAMIVGSYRMCDFNLNTLPPGLISHAEWTDENGMNNALRINGLGAPRAFFTPLLRQVQLPNTSYGEDYALGLAFSRRYRIGRIFTELYLCRRWGGNSDAVLSVEKINANNLYKDRLRTMEVMARQQLSSGKGVMGVSNALTRFFNRQLETWETARQHYSELRNVQTRDLPTGDLTLRVQFNPARMVSTGAKIDAKTLAQRPCFLCDQNRPAEQMAKDVDSRFHLLVNPFPILPTHFTIPSKKHQPQRIREWYGEMHGILEKYPELMVFYNGPLCGASAPDHLHFQAGTSGMLPLQGSWQRLSRNLTNVFSLNDEESISYVNDYPAPVLVIKSRSQKGDEQLFRRIYKALAKGEKGLEGGEPMMNIVCWRQGEDFLSVVFLRKKHRPDCYYAEGNGQILVSPGALDMAGLLITPRREDYEKLTPEQAVAILKEVSLSEEEAQQVIAAIRQQGNANEAETVLSTSWKTEPTVQVGIVSAERILFSLNKVYTAKGEQIEGEQMVVFSEGAILWNGNPYRELKFIPQTKDASFSIKDVTIGVNFHWERKETQTFQGMLRLVVEEGKICAINELPVENYLTSVISSEMSATSSIEFLKAHAVISRSWLLAQMEKRRHQSAGGNGFFSFIKKEDELIRWYDRDDHTIFDVCADDHCQRYQGITKASNMHVVEAVKATRGRILVYDGEICDARFSKCCGGVTEEFQYCWEDTPKPYLVSVRDAATPDGDPFCHTHDKHILSQVLNDYDQETSDFYRWQVEYTQEELCELIERKLKMKFGKIVSLEPLERGKSGRIWKLKIVGTERQFTIGKELEIRRALSETHLYSSAFEVESKDFILGIPQKFVLKGAGWGHGVGLCQIGAAVMGEQGYPYDEILLHYYQGAEIKKIYS